MKSLEKFHEKEDFLISLPALANWQTSSFIFKQLGFRLEDDFAERMRDDPKVLKWQSEAIASINFHHSERQVYPDEEDFDSLIYSILPCSLPRKVVEQSVTLLFELASKFSSKVTRQGIDVNLSDALRMVELWANDVVSETGDGLGSEVAQIFLEIHYRR